MVWNRQTSITPVSNLPKIAIGIVYLPDVTMCWSMKTLGPLLFIPNGWCEKIPKMVRGIPLGVARDQIGYMVRDDPSISSLLFVDTDSICNTPQDPNVALNCLHQCNVPIVSGLYRAKQKTGFNYAAWADAKLPDGKIGFTPIQSYTGNFFQVDTVGMGFCLIKREVFEKIPPPWFEWNEPAPSEDFNFCIKARKYGYTINVFADVKIDHIGELIVRHDGNISVLDI